MSERARRLYAVNTLLLVAMIGGSLLAWLWLPDPFPIHFGPGGRPDRWVPKNAGSMILWLLLPVIGATTTLLIRAAGRAATLSPGLWNVPLKREFLALTPERRAPIVATLQEILAGTALGCTALFAGIQALTFAGARGTRVFGWPVEAALLVLTLAILFGALHMSGRVRRQIEQAARP